MKPIYLFSISEHPDTININSLSIQFLKPTINFSQYDYLILTSKQAVKALEQYEPKKYLLKKGLCISNMTAESFENIGGNVLEVGLGYGDTLVKSIEKFAKEKRWLYLRAKEIASDFAEQMRGKGFQIDEVVVYESRCSKEIQDVITQEDSIYIFTSPSSVKCFLKTHTISKKSDVIVIGTSTAKALPSGVNYRVSDKKTIQSCIEIAKEYK